jgi:ABC-type transport system involved in multi-copper enzyme maturation permease subunit
MIFEIFRFECRYQLRSPLFLILSSVFFLMTFFVMASDNVQVGGLGPNLNLNASHAIILTQYVFSTIGMFAGIAFVAGAITRDYEAKTAEMFFASGISERSYLFGRFAGGTLFAILVGLAGLAGTLVGTWMPWLDSERIGEFAAGPYLFAIWAVTIPNLFVISALFFSVAALTRSMLAAYLAALAFIVVLIVISANTDQETVAQMTLADPFGTTAYSELTKYWTVFDRNYRVPEFSGALLYNRLIWITIALVALLLTAARYRFNLAPAKISFRRKAPARVETQQIPTRAVPTVTQSFGRMTSVHQFLSQLRMDIRGIIRSIPFYVMLAFGMLNVVGGFFGAATNLFGTPMLPITGVMLQIMAGSFAFIALLVIVYYAGEITANERQHKMADIIDATPYPSGIMVLSKIGALWFVITVLFASVTLVSMLIQAFNGFYNFQPGVYLTGVFFVIGGQFYLLAVLAVFLQTLVSNKFVGMLMMIVVFLALTIAASFGWEHYLYRFTTPSAPYSDMNGFGHFLEPLTWITAYWAFFCVLLIVAGHLLFQRGRLENMRSRLQVAKARLNSTVAGFATAGLLRFLLTGGCIFYNTNVLNTYITTEAREALQAEYEKTYRQYLEMPIPSVVYIDAQVDLVPEERRLRSRGTATMVNRKAEPINELHISLLPMITLHKLEFPGAETFDYNADLGYYRFNLVKPLQPGESRDLTWDLEWLNPGFPNSGSTTRIVGNGTFVNNTEIMPVPGYDTGRELTDNAKRREHELPAAQRLPKYDETRWLAVNQMGVSERTGFRTIVSTAPDQIAVAPGYLQREWEENGRRYFEYEMDARIWPFVSYSSARYEVARDRWNDIDIEVYHDPAHAFNVSSMIAGTKKSLDYFTKEFSPYQYRQFRILEFPRYARFAQSFPNTIPFSEAIGFIADLREEDDIDYVFYVTAHELAHQWWAHQAIGAGVQGMTLIVETLAQYSALMVMEREYGPQTMRRFLKYELDNYLSSRGGELIEELPLKTVEGQGYIHYRKGSVVMYALKDMIGEDNVNLALRRFLQKYAFKGAPFPRSGDLIAEFRAVAPAEHQDLITDLFENITLFDLKVEEAVAVQVGDEYEVTITVSAAKKYSDGQGAESDAALDNLFDIAIFPDADPDLDENLLPEPLMIQRQRLTGGEQTLSYRVSERPYQVGVDPYAKMIDRNPDDNLKNVTISEGS